MRTYFSSYLALSARTRVLLLLRRSLNRAALRLLLALKPSREDLSSLLVGT
jgi:hypothetical protein